MRINGSYYGVVWGNTVPAMAFREYMAKAVQPLPAASFPQASLGEGKTLNQGPRRPEKKEPKEGEQSPSPSVTEITETFYEGEN